MLLLLLTGCSEYNIRNIDLFIEKYNSLSNDALARKLFISEEAESTIEYHCLLPDKTIMTISTDIESTNIKSVSITGAEITNELCAHFKPILYSVCPTDADEALRLTDLFLESNKKEYANEMHTLKNISLYFTLTSNGVNFTVSYNEEIPAVTTVTPETAEEYSFEAVTSSISSQLFFCFPFHRQYMCCQAEKQGSF